MTRADLRSAALVLAYVSCMVAACLKVQGVW
jgi:hypothetical protein